MKKVMYLCLLVFCSFQNTALFGGGLPVLTTSEGGSGPDASYPDENCDIQIPYFNRVNIYASNLVDKYGNGEYAWPSNAHSLYLHVYVGDENGPFYEEYINVSNTWNPDWNYIGDYGPYDESAFRTSIEISTVVHTSCPVNVKSYHELVTLDPISSNYVPYPVCENRDIGGVYSCKVFDEIPCAPDACDSGDYTYFDSGGLMPYNCSACIPGSYNKGQFRKEGEETSEKTTIQTAVLPNPFKEELTLSWLQPTENEMSIKVYNTVGKLMNTIVVNGTEGSQDIDTSNWPVGIYFIITNQNGRQESIKVIKQ